jgi:hypothetical protein
MCMPATPDATSDEIVAVSQLIAYSFEQLTNGAVVLYLVNVLRRVWVPSGVLGTASWLLIEFA